MIPPLLIAGMHRSGTSATARLMHRAGLDVGTRLLEPSLDNVLGYYEDRQFCDLNLRLVSAGVGDPALQPDWAYAERLVPGRLAPYRTQAHELVRAAGSRGRAWGFKDPRTTVLLDFWLDAAPGARGLFVYRPPWEVLRSVLRANHRSLHGKADVAVAAWVHYNRELLRFQSAHREHTVLVHLDAMVDEPARVVELVQAQADPAAPRLDAAAVRGSVVPTLLHRSDSDDVVAELMATHHPEAFELLDRLEAAADLPGGSPRPDRGPLQVEVEVRGGHVGLGAVLAGGPADGLEATTNIARPTSITDRAEAADAGIEALPDDLVLVVFAGQTWAATLPLAVAALRSDLGLAAVLVGPGMGPGVGAGAVVAHHPGSSPAELPAIVVRRRAWLAMRGFTSLGSRDGFEAWTFAAACVAAGHQVAIVPGGSYVPPAS